MLLLVVACLSVLVVLFLFGEGIAVASAIPLGVILALLIDYIS